MSVLVLIRHGQSQWNLENRFTGWTDVPLTPRGEEDAKKTAKALKDFHFDLGFTSKLQRASKTLRIILEVLGQSTIPIASEPALNERNYGDLTGLNKAETAAKYGQEQVLIWRRSYSTPPPGGESIADVCKRVLPFFQSNILSKVWEGKNIIITASGNSMRPMIQFLDHLDDETTATMEVGLCTPYVYHFEGEQLMEREVLEVTGIVTKGASQMEAKVEEGRI